MHFLQIVLLQAGLWATFFALFAVFAMLLRRVRMLGRRIAPLGALSPEAARDSLAGRMLSTLSGTEIVLGAAREKAALLLFVDASCPVSRKMAPIARSFARREGLALYYVGDGEDGAQRAGLAALKVEPDAFVNDSALGLALGVDRLPYAVLLDEKAAVEARGLVNSREHLESLVSVRESGHGNLQSWIEANPGFLSGGA